jgi:hypothetical protein
MDMAVSIWNLLWEYQIHIVVMLVLVVWLVVRGGDLIRWVWRKVRSRGSDEVKSEK